MTATPSCLSYSITMRLHTSRPPRHLAGPDGAAETRIERTPKIRPQGLSEPHWSASMMSLLMRPRSLTWCPFARAQARMFCSSSQVMPLEDRLLERRREPLRPPREVAA
jgi:hypothetical protein